MRLFCFYLLLFIAPYSQAQNINFRAEVDKQSIAVGENFNLTLVLENAPNINIPIRNFSPFSIVSGPFQSVSSQWINGVSSHKRQLSYFMTAHQVGTFSIPSMSIKIKGKVYKTSKISIQVVKNKATSGAINRKARKNNPDVFIETELSRNEVFVGQPLVARYKLYNRYPNFNIQPPVKLPQLDGFWSNTVKIGRVNWEPNRVKVGNKFYQYAFLDKQVIIPNKEGAIDIEGFQVNASIQAFFFNPGKRLNLHADKVRLLVKPLPTPQPKYFKGAVGNFALSSFLDKPKLKANEAMALKIKISGKGNLKLLHAPKLSLSNEFEVFDPKVKEKINNTDIGMSGEVDFEYVIIPRHQGSFTLPRLYFSYFDPFKKKYITLKSKAFKINVLEDDSENTQDPLLVGKEDVKVVKNSIRYIRKNTDLTVKEAAVFPLSSYLFSYLSLIILWYGIMFYFKKKNKISSVQLKYNKAGRKAMKSFVLAKKKIEENDKEIIFSIIQKTLLTYISDKFKLPKSQQSLDQIEQLLNEKKVNKILIDEFKHIIQLCQQSTYSPMTGQATLDLIDKSKRFIKYCEKRR